MTCSAVDSLPSTLGSFLKSLRSATGYVFTVIAGGPDLARPGELAIVECVVYHLEANYCHV
jgi:hypothetical protein